MSGFLEPAGSRNGGALAGPEASLSGAWDLQLVWAIGEDAPWGRKAGWVQMVGALGSSCHSVEASGAPPAGYMQPAQDV